MNKVMIKKVRNYRREEKHCEKWNEMRMSGGGKREFEIKTGERAKTKQFEAR